MTIAALISQHVKEAFETGNWTEIYFPETINDVSVEEATTVTDISPNTIAAIVHHLCVYNEIMLQRLDGKDPQPENNGFDVPILHNEEDWQQLQKRLYYSAGELAKAIEVLPDERLQQPVLPGRETSLYKSLHGIAEHAHYHLGQIVYLKKLIRHNKPK